MRREICLKCALKHTRRQRPRPLHPARRGRLVRDRPSKRTTPRERSIIARRRWFRYWAPQITQRGYVWTRRAKVQKAARAPHRTASRATAGSRPAPVPSRRPSSGRCLRSGPTCNVVRTTHVGPNQTVRCSLRDWPNRLIRGRKKSRVLRMQAGLVAQIKTGWPRVSAREALPLVTLSLHPQ